MSYICVNEDSPFPMMPVIYYTIRGRLTVTVFGVVALVLDIAALIVYLVAFSTHQWGWLSINDDSGELTGLWRRCRDVADKPVSCENLVGNQGAPGNVSLRFSLNII